MTPESTPFILDIPTFGKVPISITRSYNQPGTVVVTPCPPATSPGPELPFKEGQVVLFPDPKRRTAQYVIKQQKIVILTVSQIEQLKAGKLFVQTKPDRYHGTPTVLRSVREKLKENVTTSDCPEPIQKGKEQSHTVLLAWDEITPNPFPDLELRDSAGRLVTPISQTNNFLVVSVGDTNPPPPRPPVTTAMALNTQPSDFKIVSNDDRTHYEHYRGQGCGPTVALLDTGLKFNFNNLNEPPLPDPYVYRDANGQERRFVLAYQDKPVGQCDTMAENHLGYCSIQSYRLSSFRNQVKAHLTIGKSCTETDVANSPYDDFRLFGGADETDIVDARHGTSVAAIIQQNGDDAPILPVKAFDNVGFGTLFDVLNALNYVLQRCQSDTIRVLNTSWIFGRDEPLLKEKIKQLMHAGVFVVAAAGNEHQTINRNLDIEPVYPACYSVDLPNVITVTSVTKNYTSDPEHPRRDGKAPLTYFEYLVTGAVQESVPGIGSLLSTGGYEAVENFSTQFVNVGVVSTLGFFRSPFWTGLPIRGSSFACGFVSGFVVRQLRERPDLFATGTTFSKAKMSKIRLQLLKAMSGTDPNLASKYVADGYYLDGYAAVS